MNYYRRYSSWNCVKRILLFWSEVLSFQFVWFLNIAVNIIVLVLVVNGLFVWMLSDFHRSAQQQQKIISKLVKKNYCSFSAFFVVSINECFSNLISSRFFSSFSSTNADTIHYPPPPISLRGSYLVQHAYFSMNFLHDTILFRLKTFIGTGTRILFPPVWLLNAYSTKYWLTIMVFALVLFSDKFSLIVSL